MRRRSGRKLAETHCVDGNGLGICRVYASGPLGPGSCEGCESGPLHGPLTKCSCSYYKGGQRLCRDCAIAFDYVTVGHTKITDAPFTPRQWAAFTAMQHLGAKAVAD